MPTFATALVLLALTAAPPPTSPATFLGPPVLGPAEGGVAGGPITLHVHGRIAFSRVVESAPSLVGAARVRVEIWDEDDVSDELMAVVETDLQGFYDTTFTWDDCDFTGCDDPDLYVIVRTVNDEQDIERDDLLQTTYAWSTDNAVLEDVTSSEVDLGIITPGPSDEQGAAHVHTVLALARATLEPTGIGFTFPQLEVDWSASSTETSLDDTRISLSGPDGWSEVEIARQYLLFFFEQRYNEPLGNLCNGICDDNGCGACLWCIEAPAAAWRLGCALWFGDALSRAMPATTGAPPLVTVGEIDATFPCPDGLPVEEAWVPGYTAAILRDLEDDIELLDVNGDGIDDAPAETACERDSLSRGIEDVVFSVFFTEHADIDDFVAFEQLNANNPAALWRTLRRIAGDRWSAPDAAPPVINVVTSSTHPGGVGAVPIAQVSLFASDAASGVAGYSIAWAPTPVAVDTTADLDAAPVGPTSLNSPQIPYNGQLYLSVRAVDCVGHWTATVAIGPFVLTDCDDDGVPDLCACGACDTWPGYCPPETCGIVDDCNGNLVPDECDIAGGVIDDCNLDGIDDACQATTNTFDPPPGTPAFWNVASSWSSGALPNAGDLACLHLGNPLLVTRLQGAGAEVFAFGCDHTLELLTSLSAVGESRTTRLDMVGGTFTGAGDLIASEIRWTNGTITRLPGGDPRLIVGSLTTIGSGSRQLGRDTSVFEAMHLDAGTLSLNGGMLLELAAGSLSTVSGGSTMTWSFGNPPTFQVSGELHKIGAGLAQVQSLPTVLDGSLVIDQGEFSVGDCEANGATEIASGATFRLASGDFTMGSGASITGGRVEAVQGAKSFDGTIDVDQSVVSNANVTLADSLDWSSDALTLSGGSIAGDGDANVGSFLWSAGTMSGAGSVATDALALTGNGQKNLARTLTVAGEATYSGATFGVSQGGTLAIGPRSTFTITGDGGVTWISGSQPGTILNDGVVRKNGANGTTNLSFVGLVNHGLVAAETGTLRFSGTTTHDGSLFGLNGTVVEFVGGDHTFGGASVVDAGTFAVTAGTATVGGLFESDFLQLGGGTLEWEPTANAETSSMTMSGGTLTGAGNLVVSGPFQWTSGSMQGTGVTTLAGPSVLSGASSKSIRRPVTVLGSLQHTAGTLGVDGGGLLEIATGGELALAGGTTTTWVAGPNPGSILVHGSLRKSADSGLALINFATLTVNGDIDIDGGTLQIGGPLLVAGDVTSVPGAELRLSGSDQQVLGPGGTVDVGTLRIAGSGGIVNAPVLADATIVESGGCNVNGPFTTHALTVNSGTVGGIGSMQVNGPAILLNPLFNGSGTIDFHGPVSLQSASQKNIARTVRMHGPTTWTAGIVGVSATTNGTGLWHFMPGSSLDVSGANLSMTWISGNGPGSVVNEGTIRSLPSTATTTIGFLGFTNAGTLDIGGPLWRHNGGSTFLQTAGTTIVRSGCELEHTSSITFAGGVLTGSGLVDANVSLGAASVQPGDSIGTLTIDGTATFGASSTLATTIASSQQDRLTITGNATVAGTILVALDGGFVPAIGDSFVVLTCAARSGTFAGVTAVTPLPSDRRWAIQHNPANVTIVVVPALPCAGDLDLDATVGATDLALLLGAWGTDGQLLGADLNEDGTVSAPDLAILLGAWGPCPIGAPDDAPGRGGIASAAGSDRVERPLKTERAARAGRRAPDRPSDGAAEDRAGVDAGSFALPPALTPERIAGDLTLTDATPLERTIRAIVIADEGACAFDADLLVIDGTAALDGTIRLRLDESLHLDAITCLRILVADRIIGRPRIELVDGDDVVELDAEIGDGWIDVLFGDQIEERAGDHGSSSRVFQSR